MSAHNPAQQCCLWDNYKYAIYTRLREPKLYRYAAQGDWDLIPHRCKTHPKEATFVHKYAPMDTALHRLLRTETCAQCSDEIQQDIFDMKQQAVSALLHANPSAVSTRDTFQRTPLHWACMDIAGNTRSVSTEFRGNDSTSSINTTSAGNILLQQEDKDSNILFMLLERAPQAVCMVDIERRTPLHYIVARNDDIPLTLLAKMVALYPEALSMKDEVGDTPLDIIRSRREELTDVDNITKTLLKLQSMLTPSTPEIPLENETTDTNITTTDEVEHPGN